MGALKREHEQLYGQAGTFQDQHSRHENSINAILTFLATVYNRSLQGHEGMQGIQNLFSGAIPNEQPSGTVVDMGDYAFDNLPPADSPNKQYRKPPLLLTDASQQGRAATMSPSTASSPFPNRQGSRSAQSFRGSQTPQASVQEVFDSGTTPTAHQNIPSQQDIMDVIQNTNARNSTPNNNADLSNMISDLQNAGGSNPLNATQRADMLRLINNTGGNKSTGDNALINTTPPPYPSNFDRQLANSKANYDSLAKMQAEQDKSVQNLTNLLQPLSPSGSIPGLHDNTNLPPAPWDVDDFLNAGTDYFNDFGSDGVNFDINNLSTDTKPAAQGFDDYDDMFKNVPATENVDTNGDSSAASYDGNRGRVESASVASSEVATPESSGAGTATGAAEAGKAGTSKKGRKLSTSDTVTPVKKSRRG